MTNKSAGLVGRHWSTKGLGMPDAGRLGRRVATLEAAVYGVLAHLARIEETHGRLNDTFVDAKGARQENAVMVPLPLLRKLQAAAKSK